MTTTLYYNYYIDRRPDRRAEIDACLRVAARTAGIDRIVLLVEQGTPVPIDGAEIESIDSRPTFAHFFAAIARRSSEADVNIILNSDCFLDPRDLAKCRSIAAGQAYCIRRRDVNSAEPIRLDRLRNLQDARRCAFDMQDAWVIRGRPRATMRLDYPMGKPGCDNRLAHELASAGYRILDPFHNIRLYHFHRARQRGYTEADRVEGPYAYPQTMPPARRAKRIGVSLAYKAHMLEILLTTHAMELPGHVLSAFRILADRTIPAVAEHARPRR